MSKMLLSCKQCKLIRRHILWRMIWIHTVCLLVRIRRVNTVRPLSKRFSKSECGYLQTVWVVWDAEKLGPVVQSVVSLTSSLRVISLTVSADSMYNILIFFAEKKCEWLLLTFFSKKFQHTCVSLDVNFNESLTNDVVSFEQLGPDCLHIR